MVAQEYSATGGAIDQALKKLEEHVRLLSLAEETAQLGHWRFDLNQQELHWSEQVFRIHGLDPQTFAPSVEASVAACHPEDRERVEQQVANTLVSKQPFNYEFRVVRPNGTVRNVHSRGQCELDHEDQVVALFGIVQDITERKELETRVLRSERMASLGTLSAGMAHEINNPLSYLLGNLEVVAEELRARTLGENAMDNGALFDAVEEARQGAGRVSRIVRELKAFSRAEPEHRELVDMCACVDAAASMADHQIRHKAEFVKQYTGSPKILADPSKLAQIVVNLLINSAQALPDDEEGKHRVYLRCGISGDKSFIEIEDTGPGIAPEHASRIFEPFFTTKDVGNGTGLGLSIVHGLVTGLGGMVTFDSEPGRTRFRVILPAAQAEEQGDAAHIPRPSIRTRRLVLVVDDDQLVRRATSMMLQRSHDVLTAESGEEALSILQDNPGVEVILLDLMMPGMGGEDVYAAITTRHAHLKGRIGIITGGAFTPQSEAFLERTPAPVLPKPYGTCEIRDLIQRLATGPRGPAESSDSSVSCPESADCVARTRK